MKVADIIEPIIFEYPERLSDVVRWHGHIPFAFWCIKVVQPKIFVELGTYKGDSYCAFCQAVHKLGLSTACYAVDHWKGDAYTGFYGEEVFETLRAYHDERYGAFSQLVRSTFDEGVLHFLDGSVDLLHIDGSHTYEAVHHDFTTWLPKLSRSAVVLFHNINLRERGFGAWRFWEELCQQYPHFSFLHSDGLGVLAVGQETPPLIQRLCALDDGDINQVRSTFARLGCTVGSERGTKYHISLFDTAYYLEHSPDVARAGVDPLQHYATSGWKEGRDPHAFFDTSYYLEHNPDVARAGVDPLWHYATIGWKEGRDAYARTDQSLQDDPTDSALSADSLRVVLEAVTKLEMFREEEIHRQDECDLTVRVELPGHLLVAGWAAGSDAMIRVEVLCDGAQIGEAQIGLPRLDVAAAYPHLQDAGRCGFQFFWDTREVAPGPHGLVIRAVDAKHRVKEAATTVIVEQWLRLSVDEPELHPELRVSGRVLFVGWAFGPSPVEKIEVLCDGERVAQSQVGLPRADIAAAYPGLPGAEWSGYSLYWDTSSVPRGAHLLAVRATDARGDVRTVESRVVVEELAPSDSTRLLRDTGALARAGSRRFEPEDWPPVLPPLVPQLSNRLALYTASLGNYFSRETRDLLATAFRALGLTVDLRNEVDGFGEDAEWHIVIAPHEFFYLGFGKQLLQQPLPRRLVLVNTEQPSAQCSLARECFPKACSIWDINYGSFQFLASKGIPCGYLPLGYVPGFELFNKVDELPEHYGTCFLEPEIRGRSYLQDEFRKRPIDILFAGHCSPRRDKFFAEAASVLSRYRCYLHFFDASGPILPGQSSYMDTPTLVGLAQRSKILLNIHQGEDPGFEWHRNVMLGIWQRALVVSEICAMAPPFRAGVDFVSAPLDDVPDVLQYYLSSPQGAKEADEIVQQAAVTLTEKCRLEDCLRPLIGVTSSLEDRKTPSASASV